MTNTYLTLNSSRKAIFAGSESMLGLLGVSVGREEGFELNLLGLNFGIDFFRPALKLPFIGRLGVGER